MKYWDRAWNPVHGCTPCSEGCDNCLARTQILKRADAEKNLTFDVTINKKQLYKKFDNSFEFIMICSLGDLFHEDINNETIDTVLMNAYLAKSKTFAILTKRSARMLDYFKNHFSPELFKDMTVDNDFNLNRFIFGVTVENEKCKNRVQDLIDCPAIQNRFIGLEPLLESVNITPFLSTGMINWVVVGAESGDNHRECNLDWINLAVNDCFDFNVPCFVNNVNIGGKVIDAPCAFPRETLPLFASANFRKDSTK